MVDPPPFSGESMKNFGIPPNLIDKIIITHCHADHDAGCFQKILMEHQIEIVTLPTIMNSFCRKYAALTGYSVDQLKQFFVYRPVTVGSLINICGAEFRFFYSFHAIPALGFEVFNCGRSIYYSGDTFYNPDALRDIWNKGNVMNRQRFEALTEINWANYDLILHEAGVPPIHTPTSVLLALPEEVKSKILVYHIAAKDVPPGLLPALVGLENTTVLPVYPAIDKTIQKLELLSSIDLFNQIPLNKAKDLIRCCRDEEYNAEQIVIREGTYGDKFYIVMNGIAKIYSSSKGDNAFEKYIYPGDYFGETAILNNGKRNANVTACTS